MSTLADHPPGGTPASAQSATGPLGDVGLGLSLCPFLRSRDGAWTSAYATRELRCWAVRPAAQLTTAKQRQFCVAASHLSCATYAAAVAAEASPAPIAHASPSLWPEASPIPVVLDAPHTRPGVSVSSPRAGGQAVLVGLMVVAFLVLVIARTTVPLGSESSPRPSAAASAFIGASSAPSGSEAPAATSPTAPSQAPSPTPVASSPSPAPSVAPSASGAVHTHKVKANETLSSIAAKFGITWQALAAANGIKKPYTIHQGQVLVIP